MFRQIDTWDMNKACALFVLIDDSDPQHGLLQDDLCNSPLKSVSQGGIVSARWDRVPARDGDTVIEIQRVACRGVFLPVVADVRGFRNALDMSAAPTCSHMAGPLWVEASWLATWSGLSSSQVADNGGWTLSCIAKNEQQGG